LPSDRFICHGDVDQPLEVVPCSRAPEGGGLYSLFPSDISDVIASSTVGTTPRARVPTALLSLLLPAYRVSINFWTQGPTARQPVTGRLTRTHPKSAESRDPTRSNLSPSFATVAGHLGDWSQGISPIPANPAMRTQCQENIDKQPE